MSNAALFSRSADAFVGMLGAIQPEQWELPGIGNWSVRSLAGHTARAILTVENYISQEEPGTVTISSAESYYATVYQQFTDTASVEARGVEAGEWLGDNPLSQVSSALARTKSLVDAQLSNRIVSIGGMGILLTDYLRTRVLELVVHTMDLSRATGIEHSIPQTAIADSVNLVAAVATQRGDGEQVLLAFTGRGSLPHDFSVV